MAKILIKKSSTEGAVPESLDYGELAVNCLDGSLYVGNELNEIIDLNSSNRKLNYSKTDDTGEIKSSDTLSIALSKLENNSLTNELIVSKALNELNNRLKLLKTLANNRYNIRKKKTDVIKRFRDEVFKLL